MPSSITASLIMRKRYRQKTQCKRFKRPRLNGGAYLLIFLLQNIKFGEAGAFPVLSECFACGLGRAGAAVLGMAAGSSQKNRDTAQYTKSSAITVFTSLVCLENSHLNTEPNADHSRVNAKPIKARRKAKHTRAMDWP